MSPTEATELVAKMKSNVEAAQAEVNLAQADYDQKALEVNLADSTAAAAKAEAALKVAADRLESAQGALANAQAVLRGSERLHADALKQAADVEIARRWELTREMSEKFSAQGRKVQRHVKAMAKDFADLCEMGAELYNLCPDREPRTNLLSPQHLQGALKTCIQKHGVNFTRSAGVDSFLHLPEFSEQIDDSSRWILKLAPSTQDIA